ncbi:hypothetical protein BDV29DRAFT_91488 [Aspergillus leporis]|uniref:Uncharacterized protein n=1 Tax=Aspergillus leporis TaxID=41062 RepID=A0A5N5WGE7_9EURO|nr:hypothetical protein BDV29DRAFT_91488 [Aspergillus leporis]
MTCFGPVVSSILIQHILCFLSGQFHGVLGGYWCRRVVYFGQAQSIVYFSGSQQISWVLSGFIFFFFSFTIYIFCLELTIYTDGHGSIFGSMT